jgi:hypothetical protein
MKKIEEYWPPEILELAKKNALEMKAGGENLRSVQFGQEAGSFYLSDSSEKIVSIKTLEVEGKTFHIGLYEK